MPNFSGKWNLQGQLQGIKQGDWTGINVSQVFAWGNNNGGRIGDNTAIDKSSPIQIASDSDWSVVSAGSADSLHTLGVKTDGTLWAWGNGSHGRLGNNTSTGNVSSPVQIGSLTTWSIAKGAADFSLGVADGKMYAWGYNQQSQLGINNTTNQSSPVQIGVLTNWSSNFSGAYRHGLAVKTDNTLWAWGFNNNGRIGDNTTISRSSPVQIGALTTWAQAVAGRNFSLARKTDGTLWAIGGQGYFGALGIGIGGVGAYRSSPVQIGALATWTDVTCGQFFSAAIENGKLYAWGRNNAGQLGQNNTTDRSSPVQVGALTNWSQISASEEGCMAIKTDGTLWAWGNNAQGRLGLGNTTNYSSPVQVGGLSTWSTVDAGRLHVVAVNQFRTGMS